MTRKEVRDNRVKLWDLLKSEEYGFDMASSLARPDCGSAGCIQGHGAIAFKEDSHWSNGWGHIDRGTLADKLGLSLEKLNNLCYPSLLYSSIERHHAIAVMDRLIKTGKVSWKGVVG